MKWNLIFCLIVIACVTQASATHWIVGQVSSSDAECSVDGADVELKNEQNGDSTSESADSSGYYTIDLDDIDWQVGDSLILTASSGDCTGSKTITASSSDPQTANIKISKPSHPEGQQDGDGKKISVIMTTQKAGYPYSATGHGTDLYRWNPTTFGFSYGSTPMYNLKANITTDNFWNPESIFYIETKNSYFRYTFNRTGKFRIYVDAPAIKAKETKEVKYVTVSASMLDEVCFNGVQDTLFGETNIDCGGRCPACPSCFDGIQNQNETGVDCGGSCNATCQEPENVTINETINITKNETAVEPIEKVPCVLESVSIYPECPAAGCKERDKIRVGARYSGDCPASAIIQIDAISEDGLCDVQHDFGNMRGIDVACESSPCVQYWGVPYVNTNCAGKTVTTISAGLYARGIAPEAWIAYAAIKGSFSFASAESTTPKPNCSDGVQNQNETGVDCGGVCQPCGISVACKSNRDCITGYCANNACANEPTCYDGILNQGEKEIDCGGPCGPCPETSREVMNAGQPLTIDIDIDKRANVTDGIMTANLKGKGAGPVNIQVDIGNDSTIEWDYHGDFSGIHTIDMEPGLNEVLDDKCVCNGCIVNQTTCCIPLIIWVDKPGTVDIVSMPINYRLKEEPAVVPPEPKYEDQPTITTNKTRTELPEPGKEPRKENVTPKKTEETPPGAESKFNILYLLAIPPILIVFFVLKRKKKKVTHKYVACPDVLKAIDADDVMIMGGKNQTLIVSRKIYNDFQDKLGEALSVEIPRAAAANPYNIDAEEYMLLLLSKEKNAILLTDNKALHEVAKKEGVETKSYVDFMKELRK